MTMPDPVAALRRDIDRALEDIPPNRETHRLLARAHALLGELAAERDAVFDRARDAQEANRRAYQAGWRDRENDILARADSAGAPLATDLEAAAFRRGAEAMREALAVEMDCACACRDQMRRYLATLGNHTAERWRICERADCAAETAYIIRALPLPEDRP